MNTRVVLVRDGGWPELPGVCCWRHGSREAFAAAGAAVDQTTWQPPAKRERTPEDYLPPSRPQPARLGWLPPTVRRPIAGAFRRTRRLARRSSPPGRVTGLDGAAVVVAETMRAAKAVLASGVPGHRVWALALPDERAIPNVPSAYGTLVAQVAPTIGGFLTDSEPARESLERSAATGRPSVVVFPPVVQACPTCAGADPGADTPPGTPPAVAQLILWRALLGGTEQVPYSFPAARMRGFSGPWTPEAAPTWGFEAQKSPYAVAVDDEPLDLTVGAQERGARAVLDRTVPREPHRPRPKRSVLISGYDLKFARELGHRLDNRTDLDVTFDEWPGIDEHTSRTASLVAGADVVFAEWARPTAAWLAERAKPGSFLVVRLHRFELDSGYARQIDIGKFDAIVYVSPPIGTRIVDELGWPKEKLVYIPNFMDLDWVDRPKLPGARFTIGLVGTEWSNKRLDLALDLLAAIRADDPRFTLFVRSVPPWDNAYVWNKPEQRQYVAWCQERIERDPLLRGAVVFDPPGRDMARWYRRVGTVLSTSDIESFHLGVAEGMASGAVPIIRPWAGAREIYDNRWIHATVDAAATAVLANADEAVWSERAETARKEMRGKVDPAAVVEAWADLLNGEIERARAQFAKYAHPPVGR